MSIRQFNGRYVVLIWFVTLFVLPEIVFALYQPAQWYRLELAFYYAGHVVLGIFILTVARHVRLDWGSFLGRVPDKRLAGALLLLYVALWILSGALSFLVFYPLSLQFPGFVTWWYIDYPAVVVTDFESFLVLPNILSFASLTILTPVIEEVLFRGFLLHRWAHKYGPGKAVLMSSILFGVMHPDIVSATFFGIAMSVLYLRTGSLIAAIIVHAVWNSVHWIIEYYHLATRGLGYRYSLQEFQDGWIYGVVYVVLSIAIVCIYVSRTSDRHTWKLPAA